MVKYSCVWLSVSLVGCGQVWEGVVTLGGCGQSVAECGGLWRMTGDGWMWRMVGCGVEVVEDGRGQWEVGGRMIAEIVESSPSWPALHVRNVAAS